MKPMHHLDEATLLSYSAGALPAAFGVVAAAHLAYCQTCRLHLLEADQIGGVLLEQQRAGESSASARDAMLALLGNEPPATPLASTTVAAPSDDPDLLPQSLHAWFGKSMRALRWRWVAPGVQRIRARNIDGGDLMMLRFAQGSRLPLHTHAGSELTLVLDGAYDDMLGHFGPGDVADLDGETRHAPVTSTDVACVCVAALDAPVEFAGRVPRLLQPLLGF